MKKISLFSIKNILLTIAFGLIIYQSWGELANIAMIPLFIIVGYLFGKLTCSNHLHRFGFWATFGLFTLLNTAHSLIDGTSVSVAVGSSTLMVMIIHEVIRQPILYVIIWALLAPFPIKHSTKILVSFISVTGTWIAGMILGKFLGNDLGTIEWAHPYLASSIFILAGDMIHHVWDEYHHQ